MIGCLSHTLWLTRACDNGKIRSVLRAEWKRQHGWCQVGQQQQPKREQESQPALGTIKVNKGEVLCGNQLSRQSIFISLNGGGVWRRSVKSRRVRRRQTYVRQRKSDRASVLRWLLFFVDSTSIKSRGMSPSSPWAELSFNGSGKNACQHICEDETRGTTTVHRYRKRRLAGGRRYPLEIRVASLQRGTALLCSYFFYKPPA